MAPVMGLTLSQRQAVTKAVATRYRRADKAAKGKILDEDHPPTSPAAAAVWAGRGAGAAVLLGGAGSADR